MTSMMTPDEALELCQPYLDRELDAETAARVDACIAANPSVAQAFAEEREFLSFIKERSAVAMPPGLMDGIKARLAKETAPAVAEVPKVNRFARRRFLMMAASVAAAVGVGTYLSVRKCPYMLACAAEHAAVTDGKRPLQIQTDDRAKLAAFVAQKLNVALTDLPALSQHNFAPAGAAISSFESLKRAGSPDLAFVTYRSPEGETVTLFIHPWAAETPSSFNKMQYNGDTYWSAVHGGKAVAAWKSDDNKLVLSVVSQRSKSATLEIAEEARQALRKSIASL